MNIKNLFSKKDKAPHLVPIKGDSIIKRPVEKKDWFGASLIMGTGLMIGALGAYIIITFPVS